MYAGQSQDILQDLSKFTVILARSILFAHVTFCRHLLQSFCSNCSITLARVPRKPISANLGLNLANRGIHFVPRLDYVPESMINLNLGIN